MSNHLWMIGFIGLASLSASAQSRPAGSQPATIPATQSQPTTDPATTRLDFRVSPLLDLHFSVRSLAGRGQSEPIPAVLEPAVAIAREIEQSPASAALWALTEAVLSPCESATAAPEACESLPSEIRLAGRAAPLQADAVRLARAYASCEADFLRDLWPGHQAAIDRARADLERVLRPRERECMLFLVTKLGMRDPGVTVPVYLVAQAPSPGGFTHRRPDGAVCCVAVNEASGPLLAEMVLHEAIHALDVASAGQQTALAGLRSRLVAKGVAQQSLAMRDVPHTLMFLLAGETVKRVLDPAHQHYGDKQGYYLRVRSAYAAVRGPWYEYLDGRLSLDAALELIVSQVPAATQPAQ